MSEYADHLPLYPQSRIFERQGLDLECLNGSWFLPMADARDRIDAWKIDYNEQRPHSALGNLTPRAYAAQLKPARRVA